MSRLVGTVISVVGAALVYFSSFYAHSTQKSTLDFVAKLSEVPSNLDSLISLGHVGAVHSFLQLWLVQNHDQKIVLESDSSVDILNNLAMKRPRFESFYVMTCHSYMKALRPENCEKVSEIGLEIFPTSYPISMTQTYTELAFFQNLKKAARYIEVASRSKNPPPFIATLLKKLTTGKGLRQEDLDHLREKTQKLYQKNGVKE